MKWSNNFFIIQGKKPKKLVTHINAILKKGKIPYTLKKEIDPMVDMNTIEQRINYYHLLSAVIENNVEGDIIELGSFTGQCAMLFQRILNAKNSLKKIHLYDSFEITFTESENIETILKNNFLKNSLPLPVIHKGLFNKTLPLELPTSIAFAHIDCGFGGNADLHKDIVLFCLQQIYPKLSVGAITVLMDYHNPDSIDPGMDCNPGVKMACDIFFTDKKEEVISLYGNEVSHAYFKKL